jgi:hypothetical protein
VLCEHPTIGPIVRPHTDAHTRGLHTLATEMAVYTAASLEAERFLTALRELIVSQRYILLKIAEQPTNESERSRMIGWQGEDGSLFLLPKLARAAVDIAFGTRGLGDLSEQTLHAQLESLGAIKEKDPGRLTKVQWIAGEKAARRVLHLTADAMKERSSPPEEITA